MKDKRTYKKDEVLKIIDEVKAETDGVLKEQKIRICELVKEVEGLEDELSGYKKKEKQITTALLSAEEKALETEEKAKMKYSLEKEKIALFCAKFDKFFHYLTERYSLKETEKAKEIFDKLKKSLDYEDAERCVEKGIIATNSLDTGVFNPKSKIEEYVSATGENGFDLDKVLNPGELQLEDLCKEMGLMEDN